MAKDKKTYDVFKGLLNGSQKHTLSSALLIKEVQEKTSRELIAGTDLYVLHDPCEIRKPSAPLMEDIGKVLSLDKTVINGYKTFNSIVVNSQAQGVHLLSHTLYSTAQANYVTQGTLDSIGEADEQTQKIVTENRHVNTDFLFRKHVKESSELLKGAGPQVNICHVLDREFDNESVFEYIKEQGDDFIIRLKLSRLSNSPKTTYTAKGNLSKRIAYQKLVDKEFKDRADYQVGALSIKGKLHHKVRCEVEWDELTLNKQAYSVVRITLWKENKPLFDKPMLLITNRTVKTADQAKSIYRGYLLRFKIEVVFRFLKQTLGWEDFQVRDFNSIKNLLAIVFFLVGYFKELERELKKHPLALLLCDLACSKGKISVFFLQAGIAKLIHFQQVDLWMKENNISRDQLDDIVAQMNDHG